MSRSISSTAGPYDNGSHAPLSIRSYVALGDSFTEGVGDPDVSRPNGVRGWADRVAEVLGTLDEGFRYANLAVRGRKLQGVLDEQLEPALALGPDLVTVYAGGNDILRPSVDIDAILAPYADAVARLRGGCARATRSWCRSGRTAPCGSVRRRPARVRADVVQWQNMSFPSSQCGFDSRHPLLVNVRTRRGRDLPAPTVPLSVAAPEVAR